jgi:hypothetical protein
MIAVDADTQHGVHFDELKFSTTNPLCQDGCRLPNLIDSHCRELIGYEFALQNRAKEAL